MTLLTELQVINTQRTKPLQHAYLNVSRYIKKVIDNDFDYLMDIKTHERIYSDENKIRIITTLQQTHQEIQEAETSPNSSLQRLKGIAEYFRVEWMKQLEENNIDIKQSVFEALSEEKEETKPATYEEKEAPVHHAKPVLCKAKASFFQKQAARVIHAETQIPTDLSGIIASYLPVSTSRILHAADWFQDWLTEIPGGTPLGFLTDGSGFHHIYSFDEYLEFVSLLRSRDIPVADADCDRVNFAREVLIANPAFFSHLPQVHPEDRYFILAESLANNITDLSVFELATSRLQMYEEYYDFVGYLREKGHLLGEQKSVDRFISKKGQGDPFKSDSLIKHTSQQESRYQFLMDYFVGLIPHLAGATANQKFLTFFQEGYCYPAMVPKTYEQFCELAQIIRYVHPNVAITDPPCSPLEYARLYFATLNHEIYFNKEDPLPVSREVLTQLAVGVVQNSYPNLLNMSYVLALISREFALIKSYEQYSSLIQQLAQSRGVPYDPPDVMPYMKAVKEALMSKEYLGQPPQWPEAELKAKALADEIAKETKKLQESKTDFLNQLKYSVHDYIDTYEEYCLLGKALKQKGYDVSDPICTKEEYTRKILEQGSSKVRPLPLDQYEIIALAVKCFTAWLAKNERLINKDNKTLNKLITFFLTDNGFYYIKNYEHLVEFTALLQASEVVRQRGFKIGNPISPLSFLLLWRSKGGTSFSAAVATLYVPELGKLSYLKDKAEDAGLTAYQALESGMFKLVKHYDEFLYLDYQVYDQSRHANPNRGPSLSEDQFKQIVETMDIKFKR